MEYTQFLQTKRFDKIESGFQIDKSELNDNLFDFQKDIVKWALRKGKAALFEDCGLGKTIQQLEFAHQCNIKTNKPSLIFAPLAVSNQTKKEGVKFGYNIHICESQKDVINGINITNYEKLHKFDLTKFDCLVLDESSILKSYSGKFRNEIIEQSEKIPYKLACTATPSPNDFMELGNHSEFLNVLTRTEMLSMFFIHDGGETSKWRLKGHAQDKFWEWVASWAFMLDNPKSLGYDSKDYDLPKLNIYEEIIHTEQKLDGNLFVVEAQTLNERREARKRTIKERVNRTKDIINSKYNEQWLIWCDYNEEGDLLEKAINPSVQVAGRHSDEQKADRMLGFADDNYQILITKPKIAGFGMNWQNCHNIIFCGLSDSYEQFYQAIRRCWRFGQKNNVNVYIVTTDIEGATLQNIKRKESNMELMQKQMINKILDFEKENLLNYKLDYRPEQEIILPTFGG